MRGKGNWTRISNGVPSSRQRRYDGGLGRGDLCIVGSGLERQSSGLGRWSNGRSSRAWEEGEWRSRILGSHRGLWWRRCRQQRLLLVAAGRWSLGLDECARTSLWAAENEGDVSSVNRCRRHASCMKARWRGDAMMKVVCWWTVPMRIFLGSRVIERGLGSCFFKQLGFRLSSPYHISYWAD